MAFFFFYISGQEVYIVSTFAIGINTISVQLLYLIFSFGIISANVLQRVHKMVNNSEAKGLTQSKLTHH